MKNANYRRFRDKVVAATTEYLRIEVLRAQQMGGRDPCAAMYAAENRARVKIERTLQAEITRNQKIRHSRT